MIQIKLILPDWKDKHFQLKTCTFRLLGKFFILEMFAGKQKIKQTRRKQKNTVEGTKINIQKESKLDHSFMMSFKRTNCSTVHKKWYLSFHAQRRCTGLNKEEKMVEDEDNWTWHLSQGQTTLRINHDFVRCHESRQDNFHENDNQAYILHDTPSGV